MRKTFWDNLSLRISHLLGLNLWQRFSSRLYDFALTICSFLYFLYYGIHKCKDVFFVFIYKSNLNIFYSYPYLFFIVAHRTISYILKRWLYFFFLNLYFDFIFSTYFQRGSSASGWSFEAPRGTRDRPLWPLVSLLVLSSLLSSRASCPLQPLVLSSLLSSLEVYQVPWLTVVMANEWQKNVLCRWVFFSVFLFFEHKIYTFKPLDMGGGGRGGTCIDNEIYCIPNCAPYF